MNPSRMIFAVLALLALPLVAAPAQAQEHRRRGTMVGSGDDTDALLAQAVADYAAAGVAMKQAGDLQAVAAQLRQQTLDGMSRMLDMGIEHERSHGTAEKHVGQGMMVLGGVVGVGAVILAAPALPVLLTASAAAFGLGVYASRVGGRRVDGADAAASLKRAGASDGAVIDALFGTNSSRASSTAAVASAPASTASPATANDGFHH